MQKCGEPCIRDWGVRRTRTAGVMHATYSATLSQESRSFALQSYVNLIIIVVWSYYENDKRHVATFVLPYTATRRGSGEKSNIRHRYSEASNRSIHDSAI